MQLLRLLATLALLSPLGAADGDERQRLFKTEPTFRSNFINIIYRTNKTSELARGYIFLTPLVTKHGFVARGGYGPSIFDQDGELVWYGNDTAHHRAVNLHVCDYLGTVGQHLCFHDGALRHPAYNTGNIRFFDNTYSQVGADFGAVGQLNRPDLHELNVLRGGKSLLQDVFEPKHMDLTEYGGPKDGWVLDCCFQEVDMQTREPLFEWCALDHLPLWDTEVFLEGSSNYSTYIAGTGNLEEPWDFWHINSMDKNKEGDYLVSARHLDAVFKIAGNRNRRGAKPGTILWRLNGNKTDFQQDFNFSRQHMVRFVNTTKDTTVITLLNNAFDGVRPTGNITEGQMIEVNNVTMSARLLHTYPSPVGNLSDSSGSYQSLPNGNVFMGWGFKPHYSEFSKSGRLLYHASFSGKSKHSSPRAWKFQWKGYPKQKPKMITYRYNCKKKSSPLISWISWNGATEVKSYRIWMSNVSPSGPWKRNTVTSKKGFETQVKMKINDGLYFKADALGVNGTILATTDPTMMFVPNMTQRLGCHKFGCPKPIYFDYNTTHSIVQQCGGKIDPDDASKYALYACIILIESISWIGGNILWPIAMRRSDRGRRRSGTPKKKPKIRGGKLT